MNIKMILIILKYLRTNSVDPTFK